MKHRGTEAQRHRGTENTGRGERERAGGERAGGERAGGERAGGEREGGMGMGMGIKKAPFGGKGAFIVFKCWPSDC